MTRIFVVANNLQPVIKFQSISINLLIWTYFEHILSTFRTLLATQKVRLKQDHTRNLKTLMTPGILRTDLSWNFLLSLRLLNIRQLRVGFSDSIFKQCLLQLHLVLEFFAQPQSFKYNATQGNFLAVNITIIKKPVNRFCFTN